MTVRKAMSIRLSEEEAALLSRTAKKRKTSKTAVIVAGLLSLEDRREPSDDELLALLKARLGREK